jgi:hypothetical protein
MCMRRSFIIIIIFITNIVLSEADPIKIPSRVRIINLNITVHGATVNSEIAADTTLETTNQTEAQTVQHIENVAEPEILLESVSQPAPSSWWQAISNHKFFTATVVVGSCYLGLLGMYTRYAYYINQKNTWSSWRSTLPLEELYQMDQETLLQELIVAIEARYRVSKSKTVLSAAMLYKFECDIAQELNFIRSYISFYRFVHKIKLAWTLPNQEKLYRRAKRKVRRLQFLQRKNHELLQRLQTNCAQN